MPARRGEILTPSSIRNRWLKVIDVGPYAVTFYNKRTGEGVRVYLDYRKTAPWPEIREWFLKLKSKEAQDDKLLLYKSGRRAPAFGCVEVTVDLKSVTRKKAGPSRYAPPATRHIMPTTGRYALPVKRRAPALCVPAKRLRGPDGPWGKSQIRPPLSRSCSLFWSRRLCATGKRLPQVASCIGPKSPVTARKRDRQVLYAL